MCKHLASTVDANQLERTDLPPSEHLKKERCPKPLPLISDSGRYLPAIRMCTRSLGRMKGLKSLRVNVHDFWNWGI